MNTNPLHTKIEKEIQLSGSSIILEHPAGFPRNECNLYLMDSEGKILWNAEKPEAQSLFSRLKLNEDGDTFSAYTTDGYACELDLKTGKLISKVKLQ